mmetsp:Transcript_31779/g.75474  ORF Transcript_31779/g.75474 Transcript_31779/m.75474 type:complete len:386 (+) Transcript_31779:91-1248(+)
MARRATAIVELKDAGITCSRDFRQWAREHHPDKGGSLEKFQRMSHLMNQAFGDSGGSPASPPEEGRHSESSETDRYSTGYSSMDGHSGMKNPSSEFRSGNTTPSFNLGDVWDKAKKLAGRWDLPLMMSMLSQVRELRFHGVALDLHSNTTGRSLRLGRPRCTPRRATLPSWLPSEADTVCNSLCNGDASLAVRLGMSHKLLGCRLRHEVETMVGVQGPGETLPRIMGAGVNLQLPGGLRHIWIHLGASPKLKDSVSLAESLQDLEASWIAAARTSVGPLFLEAGWRSKAQPWDESAWRLHSNGGSGFPVIGFGVEAVGMGNCRGFSLFGWHPFRRRRSLHRRKPNSWQPSVDERCEKSTVGLQTDLSGPLHKQFAQKFLLRGSRL